MIKRIEGLEILGLLASGGQAHVYSARSDAANLVIKMHFRNEDFLREFYALASLSHENIAHLKGIYIHKNLAGLVLEYGGPFDLRLCLNYLKRQQRLANFCIIYHIASGLSKALAYLHQCGIYHNDLSPSNILIDNSGQIRLADFGASSRGKAKTKEPAFGKRDYMAPELLSGNAGHAGSDIYALGMILMELLTGQLWNHFRLKACISLLKERLERSKPELLSWLLSSLAFDPELRPKYFFDFSSISEHNNQRSSELLSLLKFLPGRALNRRKFGDSRLFLMRR